MRIGAARRAAFALVLAALADPAAAQVGATQVGVTQVGVTFVQPERYTDAFNRFGSGLTLRATLSEMRRLFEELGRQYLRPGETLAVEVLDIDLAGYEQPNAAIPFGLRVVSDVGPPRFRLRYVLREGRRTVLSAQETVGDINFLLHYGRAAANRTFGYERELLRDWFRTRIAARQPPRR